jgi:molecular chaperone HscA
MAKISINLSTGSLQQAEIVVGIDLGTTNSLVAFIHPESKKAITLQGAAKDVLVPSIVHFGADNSVTVGQAASQYLSTQPERTIFSVKRLMGKSYQDVKNTGALIGYKIIDTDTESLVKVQVGENFYTPIELSSYILKELKYRAEHFLNTPVNKAVITVPAYFNDTQRQATRDAGKLAGLDVLRIVNEPTAASLAYGIGLNSTESKTIAVYDLGGGTFDVSILKIEQGVFEVLATNGDTNLGGDDIDKLIFENFVGQLKSESMQLSQKQSLRLLAEAAKKFLSANENFVDKFEGQELRLSKQALEKMVEPLLQNTISCCTNALQDAHLNIQEIDEVIMVGGSTRMPIIKQTVGAFFNKSVNDTINPDEVVALGAAIQASVLSGANTDILLLDVTPLSLGIETMGGLMEVLIPRNSKIPTGAAKQYTTHIDGQTNMKITVYQGERDLVQHNRKLAEFTLSGIPAMPAGLPKVEIAFRINADGILQVSARELRSNVQQTIDVKPQYGLTDEAVEEMLLASITNAKDDMQTRALQEAKVEAEQIMTATNSFITKHKLNISNQELEDTNKAMELLKTLMESGTKNELQAQIEIVNNITRPYAERVMDIAIAEAMKNKSI